MEIGGVLMEKGRWSWMGQMEPDTDLEEGHRIGVLVGWEPSCPSRRVDREEPDQTLKVRVDSRETDILKALV